MNRDQGNNGTLLIHSNDIWLGDVTTLNISGISASGPLDYLRLAVIMDKASTCVMGFYLGFTSLEQAIALALRHAVLPKQYPEEYGLHFEWRTFGVPKVLTINHFLRDSQSLNQLITKLNITLAPEFDPASLSSTEKFFNGLENMLSLGNNVAIGCSTERNAVLSVAGLNRLLVQHIVEHYNQYIHPRCSSGTRFQRWQSKLVCTPDRLHSEDLDS